MTDKEIIDDYIKEQDFFKSDTPADVRNAYYSILNDGVVHNETALRIISLVVSTIRNEYGD